MKTTAHVTHLSRLLSGCRSVLTGGLISLLVLSTGGADAAFRRPFVVVDQIMSGPGGNTRRDSYITTPQFTNITIRLTENPTPSTRVYVKPVLCRGGDLSGYKLLRLNFESTTIATNVRDGVCFKLNFVYYTPITINGVISY
jgi:hypothetical protein